MVFAPLPPFPTALLASVLEIASHRRNQIELGGKQSIHCLKKLKENTLSFSANFWAEMPRKTLLNV